MPRFNPKADDYERLENWLKDRRIRTVKKARRTIINESPDHRVNAGQEAAIQWSKRNGYLLDLSPEEKRRRARQTRRANRPGKQRFGMRNGKMVRL